MLVLNYLIPALDFQGWHALIRDQEYQLENPPKELHLVMDITRLNQTDIDWIRYHCVHIIPELKILLKKHNEKVKEYRKTLNKALPKEDIKLMKKAPRINNEVS
jgi:hypothetical protein